MDSKGWIKIDRNLLDHPIWKEKPYSKGQAWIDILLLAEWKPRYIRVGDRKRKVNAGQCWITLSTLATRWGWHKETVRRFLKRLEREGSVSLHVTADATRLTVENWASYQHDVSDDVSAGVFPTINIKNKESDAPFGGEEPDDDEGMTEEEWNELVRVQAGGP